LPIHSIVARLKCIPFGAGPLDHMILYNTTLRSPFAVPTLVLS
jgi:hypothetical protein